MTSCVVILTVWRLVERKCVELLLSRYKFSDKSACNTVIGIIIHVKGNSASGNRVAIMQLLAALNHLD